MTALPEDSKATVSGKSQTSRTGEAPTRRAIGRRITPPSVDRFCGGLVPIVRVAPCKCDKSIER